MRSWAKASAFSKVGSLGTEYLQRDRKGIRIDGEQARAWPPVGKTVGHQRALPARPDGR